MRGGLGLRKGVGGSRGGGLRLPRGGPGGGGGGGQMQVMVRAGWERVEVTTGAWVSLAESAQGQVWGLLGVWVWGADPGRGGVGVEGWVGGTRGIWVWGHGVVRESDRSVGAMG